MGKRGFRSPFVTVKEQQMVILKGKWSAVALVAGMAAAMQSAPAFSAMQTWDWSNSSNSFSSNNFGITNGDAGGATNALPTIISEGFGSLLLR